MKTTITILLGMTLGLFVAADASAQITPGMIRGMKLGNVGRVPYQPLRPTPQPSTPTLTPGVLESLGNSIPLQRYLPSGTVPIPPGPIREINPTPTPAPTPMPAPPSPAPQPRQPGVVFNIGPNGGSLGIPLGGGNRINLGLPGRRFQQPYSLPQPQGYHIPGHVTGYGPYGQVHTGSGYVAGSAHATGRNFSQNNGTRRQVQRPIHDGYGNVIGYQQGTVWNNSITGQEHGNMTTYTPNSTGGTHQSTTMYSTAGGNITPIGN